MSNLKAVLFLLVILTVQGCALNSMMKRASDQNISVSPKPLEVHADTVSFDISVTLPPKMLKPNLVYALDPQYEYGNDQAVKLDRIEFAAEDFPNSDEQSPKKTSSFSFPYSEEYKNGSLTIAGIGIDPRKPKETPPTPRVEIAKGVVTTSQMVEKVMYPSYAFHGYNTGEELEPTYIQFYFDQGRSVLKRSEVRSERGEFFRAFIASKIVTRTVTITGTHSPEGPERINSDLAEERAQAIEDYYRSMMNRYDYEGMADSIEFILKPVVENWEPLKDSLALYDGFTASEKDEILEIVNGAGTYVEKEDRLHQLPTYDELFDEIYPKLRVAKTEILTVIPKKTEAQIAVLAKQMVAEEVPMDTLSNEELLYAATLTPSVEEKEKIYLISIDKEDTWVAHANLGAVYFDMAVDSEEEADMIDYMNKAVNQLELSIKMGESAEAYATLAGIYAVQDKLSQAQEALDMGFSMNPSNEVREGLNAVKGYVNIKLANYGEAIAALEIASPTPDNMFNKGLAQLLDEKYDQSIDSFDKVIEMDADYGKAYYAAAVASARKNDESGVVDYLSKAASTDSEYAEMAIDDLVFADYAGSQAFQDAIK